MSDFTRASLDGEIEILMHSNGTEAMVVWPWWADPEKITAAVWHAETMGYEDITEMGQMEGYSIPEVECSDWDYMVVRVAS